MNILGISCYYHDSAATLIKNGRILSAAQEERFSRIKHDPSFPFSAIKFCLENAEINPCDLDFVVFYEKPFLKFDRILETYFAFAPKGFKSFSTSLPVWVKDKLFQKSQILRDLNEVGKSGIIPWEKKLFFSDHHMSHAASAFYPSPFKDAAILTMDGVGEWSTTSIYIGSDSDLVKHKELNFPHSLGLLYSSFTYFTGFKVNSGEYKLMGLAPYGQPKYADLIREYIVDIKPDGSFHLDMSYFDFCTGLQMTNDKFAHLFGGRARNPEGEITQREMDLAASIQHVTEEIVLLIGKNIRNETGLKNLCLAGGVALNCVANGKLQREKIFDNIWVQPASGDAGGSLGAALAFAYQEKKQPRVIDFKDSMRGSYLGPSYSQNEIERRLKSVGAIYDVCDSEGLICRTVEALSSGMAVGWHQGRMEFGPRALGARSILADPRSPKMQKQLNLKVKFRESFRPFAPSVLSENVSDWFDIDVESPYMLMVAELCDDKKIKLSNNENELFGVDKLNIVRSKIPAVTHVDYSARIQTVTGDFNEKYYHLLTKFKEVTKCPVLVNTSFNVRGEPIVNTPEDAFKCFMATDIDFLAIGNCILEKNKQNPSLSIDYKNVYQLD